MIVYHLRRTSEVPELLANGLARADGRHYLFARWQDALLVLDALHRQPGSDADPCVALVIDADEDMLAASAIPESRLPESLLGHDLRHLQSHSYYAEVDVSPHRIRDVKNGFGESIANRHRTRALTRAPIWRFLAYAKPYWRYVLIATLCGLVKFLAPLAFPWMLKVLLDDVVLNASLDAATRERMILQLVGGVLAVNVVWMVGAYYRSVFAAVAGHRLIRDLRIALFSHVQRLSHDFFTRHQTGAISSRVVNDIGLAQNFVGSALTNVWMDAALLAALVGILFAIHPMMTLISLALMPIYVIALRSMGPRIRHSSREVQQRLEVLSGELHEKVAGVAIVKGFVARVGGDEALRVTRQQAAPARHLLCAIHGGKRGRRRLRGEHRAGAGGVVRRAPDSERPAHGRRAHAVPALPGHVLFPAAATVRLECGAEQRARVHRSHLSSTSTRSRMWRSRPRRRGSPNAGATSSSTHVCFGYDAVSMRPR